MSKEYFWLQKKINIIRFPVSVQTCRLNILINRQLKSRSIKTAHLAGLACFWWTWFLLQSYVIQVTPVMWLSWLNIILKCQRNTTFDEKIFWITLSTYVQKFFSAGLTILKNFSPIRQSKISFAGLTILSNFCHSRYCMHFWTYLVPRASATKGPRTLGTIFLAYAIAVCPLVVSLRKESLRQPEVSLSPRLSFFQPSARSLLA